MKINVVTTIEIKENQITKEILNQIKRIADSLEKGIIIKR